MLFCNYSDNFILIHVKDFLFYIKGENIPRGGIPSTLPSPRAVTNLISDESLGPKNQADKKRSGQSFAQGQTLAHDLVDTKLLSGKYLLSQIQISSERVCSYQDVLLDMNNILAILT